MRTATALLIAFALLGGCRQAPPPVAEAPKPVAAPFLIHLPGIAGPMPIDRALTDGLLNAGVSPVATTFEWTQGRVGVGSLVQYDENVRQAIRLSTAITNAYREDPRRRITVTAHSGGTAVAVWALERLPHDVRIDYLVLIASALSPTYDLSPALSHVRKRAISFHSPYDNVVLGTGTRMLGTMDRQHTDAAGLVGFKPPAQADAAEYTKLQQLPYDVAWKRYGNYGDHIGVMTTDFAAGVLGPMLDPAWPTEHSSAMTLPK